MLVFEKQPAGSFCCLHTFPEWFNEIVNDSDCQNKQNNINLSAAFPFLEYFIEEAMEEKTQQKISSGIWTEINKNNQDTQLEAHAIFDQQRFFIIIENKSPDFAAHHHVYQKARELALVNERLTQELYTYQRQLQSDIEKKILAKGNKQALLTLIETSHAAVMICKADGCVEVHNKALQNLYKTKKDAFFKHSALLDQWLIEAQPQYPEINTVLKAGSNWEGEFKSNNLKDEQKWIRLSITPVFNEENENGSCIIKYPKNIFCKYSGSNKKIIVSNGKSLVIKNENNGSYYIYPLNKTPFVLLLDKEFLISRMNTLELINVDNKFLLFKIFENNNVINIFFDKKDFNLVGWQTEDIYQNLSITFISSIKINQDVDDKIFIIPKNN